MSILLATLIAAAAPAAGPSFDCAAASTRVEKRICANPELIEADRLMAIAYSKVGNRKGLEREQRAWLADRDLCDRDGCIASRYEWRTMELIARIHMPLSYERRGPANAPAHLDMAPLGDGRHLFRLTALWIYPGGMNANDSLADGIVRIANGRGTWRGGDGCTLTFTRKGRGWMVEEAESCRNGLNVTMGGHYRS